MQSTQTAAEHKATRDASSAAHTAKVADDKEKERLRVKAYRDKKKAENVAATAALLQLNAPHVPEPLIACSTWSCNESLKASRLAA